MWYGVVFFTDLSLNVEVVGPFKTKEMADNVHEVLTLEIDSDEEVEWSRAPQIVTFISVEEAVERYSNIK